MWGPVCSLVSAPPLGGRWLGFRVNKEGSCGRSRSNTVFSQPQPTVVPLSPKYIFFLSSFLRFSMSVSIPMLTFLLLVFSLWALTWQCISLLPGYLDTEPLQIAARVWKGALFLSRGVPHKPGEDILTRAWFPRIQSLPWLVFLLAAGLPEHSSGSFSTFLCPISSLELRTRLNGRVAVTFSS